MIPPYIVPAKYGVFESSTCHFAYPLDAHLMEKMFLSKKVNVSETEWNQPRAVAREWGR